MAVTKEQLTAYLTACKLIAEVVRELGSIPSGHLYAQVMGSMELNTYQGIVSKLVSIGIIKEKNNVLTWNEERKT